MEEFIKKDRDVVILACSEISVFKQDHVLSGDLSGRYGRSCPGVYHTIRRLLSIK